MGSGPAFQASAEDWEDDGEDEWEEESEDDVEDQKTTRKREVQSMAQKRLAQMDHELEEVAYARSMMRKVRAEKPKELIVEEGGKDEDAEAAVVDPEGMTDAAAEMMAEVKRLHRNERGGLETDNCCAFDASPPAWDACADTCSALPTAQFAEPFTNWFTPPPPPSSPRI